MSSGKKGLTGGSLGGNRRMTAAERADAKARRAEDRKRTKQITEFWSRPGQLEMQARREPKR